MNDFFCFENWAWIHKTFHCHWKFQRKLEPCSRGRIRRSQTMLRTMLLASVAFTCAFAFHHPNAHPLTNFLPVSVPPA